MILSTLLNAIAVILSMLINIYVWIIIIAALISWVKPDPYNPIVQILYRLTNPVYARLRRIMPTTINGIDFSPLIVAIALKFIDLSLIQMLFYYATSLKDL